MPIPLRGLRTIRTLAGRVDRLCVPHRAHLQIACLEIEKTRRAAERTSASRRVAELDARLRAIEAEEAALWQRLANRDKGKRVDLPGAEGSLTARRTAGALTIRY
ncbi:MAG: hypothetical protein ABSA70_07110 [Terriglobia bacterium]